MTILTSRVYLDYDWPNKPAGTTAFLTQEFSRGYAEKLKDALRELGIEQIQEVESETSAINVAFLVPDDLMRAFRIASMSIGDEYAHAFNEEIVFYADPRGSVDRLQRISRELVEVLGIKESDCVFYSGDEPQPAPDLWTGSVHINGTDEMVEKLKAAGVKFFEDKLHEKPRARY